MCYRRKFDPFTFECELEPLGPSEQLGTRCGITEIQSPNFMQMEDYQDNTLCEYHIPQCDSERFIRVGWNEFHLEGLCREFGLCLDHVTIFGSNLDFDLYEDNPNCKALCGDLIPVSSYGTTRNLEVTFRSNALETAGGFRMNFMCTDNDATNRMRPLPGPVGMKGHADHKFRRDVSGLPDGGKKKGDHGDHGIEVHYRGKRFVVMPQVSTPSNCVELGGFSPPPIPTVSFVSDSHA